MKLLLDQDVYEVTRRFLRGLGHDVLTAEEVGLSRAADHELLRKAVEEGRIFITRDRDFGHLVFVQGMRGGVIFLRLQPKTQLAAHHELEKVLRSYGAEDLQTAFIVVEATGHRIRRLP